MSLNTVSEPPGQIENGIVSRRIAAERDDADDLGVDVGDGLPRRQAAHRHRGEPADGRQFGEMQRAEAGDVVLGPEEEQRGEREHPEVVPVVALAHRGDRAASRARTATAPALRRRRRLVGPSARPATTSGPPRDDPMLNVRRSIETPVVTLHTRRPRAAANSPATAA